MNKVKILFLFIFGFLFSACRNEPSQLVIQGMTPTGIDKEEVSVDMMDKSLLLTSHDEEIQIKVDIESWNWKSINRFSKDHLVIDAIQNNVPTGPEKTIILYQKNTIVACIFDNVSSFIKPFHVLQIFPANIIGPTGMANRNWVNIIVKNGNKKTIIKPSEEYRFIMNDKKWQLHLFGATAWEEPAFKEISEARQKNPLIGKESGLAREEKLFSVDCIIYQIE